MVNFFHWSDLCQFSHVLFLVDLNRVTWSDLGPEALNETKYAFDITIRVTNVISLINLRVAFHAINARRLPFAPLVYTLPIPPAPVAPAGQHVAPEILAAHNAWIKGSKEIAGLMLMTMEPEIQRNLEPLHAHEMLRELKTLFAQQAEHELLQTTRDFNSCRQEEGQSVSSYVLKMKGYIDNVERLGHPVTLGLGGTESWKGKNKQAYALKPKNPPPPKREDPAKDSICHKCGETGHWKRNCPQYLSELLKKKKNAASGAGGSERRNRTLLDMVRSMMSQTTLRKSFRDYALETVARILNMVPTKKALVKRDTLTKPDKLEPRSIKCIFIRYPKETMGYSFYYLPENKVLVARNAEFFENSLINQEASGSLEDLEIIQEEDTHPSIDTNFNHEEDDIEIDEPQSDIVPIRRSLRTRHAPDCMCLYIDAEEHELGDLGEPANYKAALLDPESEKRLNAMNVEMQSMKDNEVWVLVELPPNGKIVGSKWLFKKKTDMDGVVHTYKASLVAKGYTQTLGIDYEETFSPVADIRAIRILIAIAVYYDYEIWQIDVKAAFLNGYLNEEVYMEQPECFVNPKYPNWVCKLKCSIYGLKQASRQWNKRFDDKIKKFGFTQNRDEPCVYLKASGSNITFLILYVDDILIMKNNIPMLQSVKSYLERCFAMKDLGEATYIIGIKIYKDRSRRIHMQEKLKLSKSQGASTPAELKRMQNVSYALAVGFIMYAMRCTRPDVAFAQNVTSRFQQNPGDLHWTTAKNILKYLRNTKDMFIVYGSDLKRELRVSCYTDAGYLTNAGDLKSQTGYVFVLNGGTVD
nr:hypothetical protein [Tanacetum cinerariifolium]